MKRLSLQKKIDYCQRFGTLKTYSIDEAIDYFTNLYKDSEEELSGKIDGAMAMYEQGKCLCGFVVSPNLDERFDNVYQINTLPNFVKDIVYYMLKED